MRAKQRPDRARKLRSERTDAERRLWSALRDRRLCGLKFRRHVTIGPFIIDFACVDRALIIELDGGQHAEQRDEDALRSNWLIKEGWRVLRFWNNEIMENFPGVLEAITGAAGPHPAPLPPLAEAKLPLPAGEAFPSPKGAGEGEIRT